MANIPNIPNIPEGSLPPSIPNGNPNVTNIPDGAPNIPNIPDGAPNIPNIPEGAPNVPNIPSGALNIPNIPDEVPNVPNITIDLPTTPITIPSKEKPDATKWILLTGDFQKDGAIISWLEKKDLENNCASIEECTLSSLDKKIKEMKPGSSETYIAILPPDKSEFIYLYKGYKRNDLYYYRSSEEYRSGCTYRKTDVSIEELKEAAINYFSNRQFPDLENSELIDERLDDSKISEIRKEWRDEFPIEFIDKVLQNVYLFYSPEETENRIFNFISKLQAKDDVDFGRIERMVNKEMKALLLEDIVLSPSQESIVTEIVQDMVQLIKEAHNEKELPDFSDIHDRWDDKLPIQFVDKVLKNVNMFCSLEETEFKIFRFLDTMLNKENIDLDDIDGKIKKRLDNLLAENIELTDSQKTALSEIGNNMKQILIGHFEKIKAEKEQKQKEADRKKAEAEAKAKTEAEARKAEAALRQKHMEAEEKAKKEKSRKRFRLGCLGIILVIFLFSLISSSIKSCQGKHDDQEYQTSTLQEQIIDTDDEIESSNLEIENVSADEGVEAMLEKKFDYVSGYDRYFEVKKNGKYGIADLKGNVKIAPQYDYISSADDELGVIEVRKNGKYGMVSLKTLTEIIKPKYDYISSVSEESKTIEVRANSKYGLLSTTNLSEIVEPTYDYIGSYNEETGLFEVRKNSRYGLFSPAKKKEVAPCIYNYISYDGGLYHVRKDSKTGYLNPDGSILKPLQ